METLSTKEEIKFDLHVYEYLNEDTSLVGTFTLGADRAFDVSRTTQRKYPASSTIRGFGIQGPNAHTTVSNGSLFFLTKNINQPFVQISHILTKPYGNSTSKREMFATKNLDGLAFHFFLLERPTVSLPDSIMVTYDLTLYTDVDTFQVEEMLSVASTGSENVIKESQMDVARGASLALVHGAPHLLLEFDSTEMDETLFPCLVIEYPVEGRTLTEEFCSGIQPDGKYGAMHLTRGFPLTDEAVFRFFLLRKPSEDA
jgi:hypothetical protein